jgi:hypothetical protein
MGACAGGRTPSRKGRDHGDREKRAEEAPYQARQKIQTPMSMSTPMMMRSPAS